MTVDRLEQIRAKNRGRLISSHTVWFDYSDARWLMDEVHRLRHPGQGHGYTSEVARLEEVGEEEAHDRMARKLTRWLGLGGSGE